MAVILQITHRTGVTEVLCPGVEKGLLLWDLFWESNSGEDNTKSVILARLIDSGVPVKMQTFPVMGQLRGSPMPVDPEFQEPSRFVERQWDDAYPLAFRNLVWKRRTAPDGFQVPVKYKGDRHFYPWSVMGDGDYFITKAIPHRSRERIKTGMRQAAARYDMEIIVREWALKRGGTSQIDEHGQPLIGLRVTRVCGFSNLVRVAANMWRELQGRPILKIQDPSQRAARDWELRKGKKAEAKSAKQPSPVSLNEVNTCEIPQGDPYAGMNEYERNRARLAELRARSAKELEDDE